MDECPTGTVPKLAKSNEAFWIFFTGQIAPFFVHERSFNPAAIREACDNWNVPQEDRSEIHAKCAALTSAYIHIWQLEDERRKRANSKT